MLDYPIVKVTWNDAQEAGSGWLELEDCLKAKLAICCSIGWLVRNDDEKIIIMATAAKENSDEDKPNSGGDCTAIPADWVTKVEYLVPIDKGSYTSSGGLSSSDKGDKTEGFYHV